MRNIYSAFFSILFLIPILSFGQDNFREKFNQGNLLIEETFYEEALAVWLELVKENPDNANVNYKVGFCYLQSNNEKPKALPYLKKASENVTKKYNPFSHTMEEAPPETFFYLAKVKHLDYQLDAAIESYETFLDMAGRKHYLRDEAERQIKSCRFAKEQVENPMEYTITNLGPEINTEYPEYSPVISGDERAIYFTSRREDTLKDINPRSREDGMFFENIYVSYKDREGNWQRPEEVDFNELYGNDATINVSFDGQRLFIYRDTGEGDIYESFDEGDTWSEPVRLPEPINSEDHWDTHATISEDGNTIYFVSEGRDGGMGGRDIWRCKRLPTGEWSKPFNLGAPINTKYDEDGPFLHPDGKTLYFTSNGHLGMGGFDIFFSEMDEEGNWSEPQNVGYPINTVDDDAFLVTSPDGKRAYFSSEREDGYGEKDLYMADITGLESEGLAVLKGYINVADGQEFPDNLVIYVTDLNSGEVKEHKPRKRDGGFVVAVDPCSRYHIDYQLNDESFYEEDLDIPCESSYQEINKELFLNPINIGESGLVDDGGTKKQFRVELEKVGLDKPGTLVKYLDEDDNLIYAEMVDDRGYFEYHKLPKDQKKFVFEIVMDDTDMCDKMEIILYDENNEIVGKSVRKASCKYEFIPKSELSDGDKENEKEKIDQTKDKETIDLKPSDFTYNYEKFYDYNERDIKINDPVFQKFISNVVELIKENGKAVISIESSASKVPTKTYKNNDNLARKRLKDAQQRFMEALKAKHVDPSKIEFISESSLVQGPNYKYDFKSNKDTYEKYQYVKLFAK